MPDSPRIGLALIAKNEETRLPNLLASVTGCFDYAVLVDTGSTDKTIEVFNAWAESEREANPDFRAAWAPEPWAHDFSLPRRRADSLLHQWEDCEFFVWADCDDTITGAQNLRALAASMPGEINAYVFDYNYSQDGHGNSVCRLRRERIVRRGAGDWQGRVHEAQLIDGGAAYQPKEAAEWVHHPEAQGRVPDRNLKILRKWLKEEPRNPRVLGYIGTELLGRGQVRKACTYFARYLREKTGWDEERCQIHRKLAMCLISQGKLQEAQRTALEALTVMPSWPDSYLSLAEVAYHSREFAKAGEWARRVLELGCPDTLLIINPLEYEIQPRVIMAGSLGGLSRYEGAIEIGQQVLALVPDHAEVAGTVQAWRVLQKREQTAQRAIEQAQVLVAHDEQSKALIYLEQCVPHFATDHPQVVAIRSQLRERLLFLGNPELYAEHYETGGSKSEDFHSDEQAMAIAEQLPRSHFLLETLRELEAA
jgi:tetratricopeptide (TPR) repeat protein